MEMNKLLLDGIEELDIRIGWVRTDAIEINNLVILIMRSVERDVDNSMKLVLSMLSEKIDKLLAADIQDLTQQFYNVKNVSNDLWIESVKEKEKPKRTRQPRTSTVNKNSNSGAVKRTRTRKPVDKKAMTEALKIEPEEVKVEEEIKTE